MVRAIIWTAEADKDFKNIISYIEREWGKASAEKFAKHVFTQLDKLVLMPTIARATSQTGVHIFKLDRKNVLFFMIEDDFLVLLSIYPYKKDISRSKYL